MIKRFVASLALAFSLLVPNISLAASAAKEAASVKFEVGGLQVEQLGARGPAVILIPGLASGPWVWRDTAPRLSTTHRVYLVTLPGFDGRAPRPGASFDTLRTDLLALIESRELGKPVLVGHSLGGTLSLSFAATHSDRIRGVVAVDGLPVFPGTENVPDRKAMAESTRAQFGGQSREQFVAGQQMYMRTIGVLSEPLALELAALAARSDIGATADFAAQLMALDLRPELSSINVPVVEISPFNAPDFTRMGIDEGGKTNYYRSLLGGVQQLEVVPISPARHFVMFDQPEKFAAALDRALANMFESAPK
ncbi:MAG TPA: alpha/beta hydrolase [Steroidobacteraceae bacterium]|nr:alpha/beta hydrolase [Steroidobacteraceae bacterium]